MNPSFRQRNLAASLVVTLLVTAAPRLVLAQAEKASAEVLLQEGLKLEEEGKYGEACSKLEESLRLYPSLNTEYYLADCHQLAGRWASAFTDFLAVAEHAHEKAESAKEAKARERASAIAGKISRLTIAVTTELPGLVIKRDGVTVDKDQWGEALPIDPGMYTVEAIAPGRVTFRSSIAIDGEGKSVRLEIPELDRPKESAKSAKMPNVFDEVSLDTHVALPRPKDADTSGRVQRSLALMTLALGGVGLGISGVLALSAKSTYDGAHCPEERCDSTGLEAREVARGRWGVATIMLAASAVTMIGGGVLWLTAPSKSETPNANRVKLSAGVSWGGVVLGGSF
jgi:hypothetical protein